MAKKEESSGVQRELADIKRLLILHLLRSGASQAEVAVALGTSQSSVSRLFPGGVAKASRVSKGKRILRLEDTDAGE